MAAKKYRVRERAHPELLPDLLHARGVVEPDHIEKFLKPDFARDSHDPMLLPDMPQAVDRILFAREKGEKICVWSDYDCDGIPGGVLLVEFLRSIGMSVRHYIPHRHEEGYGLNDRGIDTLAGEGITLIVTVDLGITDREPVAHARSRGIDVIVTDHHLPPPVLPDALALVDPKRTGHHYPFDGLCGAGVAWKLVQAILSRDRFGIPEGQEKWLLDLAGVSTVADMVPLVDENRMLAHFGLRVLRRNRRPGFAALLDILRIKPGTITEDDIGFMISPRINAASRMDSPELAARLLASQSAGEAHDLAMQLDRINGERKTLVATTVKEVNKRLEASGMQDAPIIVMGNPNWRPGILGLVANSLAEAHGKTTFLWGREGGTAIRGSCRSDGIVNIVDVMHGASEVFDDFGGHFAAGGFSVLEDKVHELVPRLTASYEALRAKAVGEREILVDRELDLGEVSHAHRDLARLAPFGIGNEKPLFILPRLSVSRVKMFGKAKEHLELEFSRDGGRIAGVSFFTLPSAFAKRIEPGVSADVVGHVETDWRGYPRLRIVDVL